MPRFHSFLNSRLLNARSFSSHSIKAQTAFTLIELLVVIVIISIILSMATLAITTGTPKERLKTEAERFAALLLLAQDEALLNSREFGIALTENSYQFLILTEQSWQPVTENNSLRERALPAGMTMELDLDFERAEMKSSITKIGKVSKIDDVEKFETDKKKKMSPKIYLLSSGEIIPGFMLRFLFSDVDMSFSVQGIEDGSYKIQYHES